MKIENPYRHGAYHFTVATLIELGVNKKHKFESFVARLAKVWGKADAEGWKAFQSRKARNEDTGKDVNGRILQNCRVLQRTNDYGKPLLDSGAVIDLIRKGRKLMICLNAKSKKPQTPGRAPRIFGKSANTPSSKSKGRSSWTETTSREPDLPNGSQDSRASRR
jgi:hypothetical protein